jgi:CubicO group peptidase (beta-lactamase class C family)
MVESTSITMRRALLFVALLTLTALGQGVLAQNAPLDERGRGEALRLIDVWLESQQVFQRTPSLSAAIVQGGQLSWSKGYGTLDSGRHIPTTAQTLYSICSISKLFTSVAVMQLWERGSIRLDDPLTTYLPWARLQSLEEDSLPITARAVLSHSAGLPRESDFPYWTGPDFSFPTQAQLEAKIAEQAPLWPASRWFQYSNLGFALLGNIVSAESGEAYGDYVQAHVLEPLGMKDTHPFMPMALYNKRLAVGWSAVTRDGVRQILKPFDTRAMSAAAGYTSTAEDLGRFAAWQFRLLRTNRPEILRPSTLREMQRVQFTDPGWQVERGLGFNVVRMAGQTYVGHNGECPGYYSVVLLRPATETAVVLLSTGERPESYAHAVFDLIDKRQALKSEPFMPPAARALESYAGRYSAQPWHSEVVIVPWDAGLAVLWLPSANPADDLELWRHKGGDVFRRLRADGSEADEVRFERDKAGHVNRFTEYSNPHDRLL